VQPNIRGNLSIQPLSSEDDIREAAARASTIITPVVPEVVAPTPELPSTPVPEPAIVSDYPVAQLPVEPAVKPKKHRIRFAIYLLLLAAQIYWLGGLSITAITILNSTNLVIYLTGTILSFAALIQYIILYRSKGFGFSNIRGAVYSGLAVLPVVLNIVASLILLLVIHLKGFQLSLLLLSIVVLVGQLSPFVLIISTIGLSAMVRKRKGIGRVLHLWPVAIYFLAAIVAVIVVGSPQGASAGVAEQAKLEQVSKDMSTYLADRYGIQFTLTDTKFNKDITLSNGNKIVTAKVSPVTDPMFSYTAMVYIHDDISLATGERTDNPTYREDFLGEYWKSGFKSTICPTIQSLQHTFALTNCDVTNYSLKANYNDVLAKYRGNIPKFSELDDSIKNSINFGMTVETTDGNNEANVLQHVDVVEKVIAAIRATKATSTLGYYANPVVEDNNRLGFAGSTAISTSGGDMSVLSRMYSQSSKEPKNLVGINRLYYNSITKAFDLAKPSSTL